MVKMKILAASERFLPEKKTRDLDDILSLLPRLDVSMINEHSERDRMRAALIKTLSEPDSDLALEDYLVKINLKLNVEEDGQ